MFSRYHEKIIYISRISFLKEGIKYAKKWWKEKGPIDLICLLGGIALVFAYIAYKSKNQNISSPYLDLWPNIASEVLGVWISVRLIEALLNSRQDYHGTRKKIISNLISLKTLSEYVKYKLEDRDIFEFKHKIEYITEYLPKWKKYLTTSEINRISDCVLKGEQLIKSINLFLQNYQLSEIRKTRFTHLVSVTNSHRKDINDLIAEISYSKNDIEKLISILDKLRKTIESTSNSISKIEKEFLFEYLKFIDLHYVIELDVSVEFIKNPMLNLSVEEDYLWYLEIFDYLKVFFNDDESVKQKLDYRIEFINSELTSKNLPHSLQDYLIKFIDSTETAFIFRKKVNSDTLIFQSELIGLQNDLMEETSYY